LVAIDVAALAYL